MRISDWSSDVCSSDLLDHVGATTLQQMRAQRPGPQSRKIEDAWRVAHWRRGLVQGSSAYQLQPVGLRVRAGAARRERESEFATAQKQFIRPAFSDDRPPVVPVMGNNRKRVGEGKRE